MRPLKTLLEDLVRAGITLEAEGDALRVRGPAGRISQDLRDELAARKPELLAVLGVAAAAGPHPVLGPRADSDAPAPLTYNQRRLWFLDKLDETGSAFAMTAAWALRGAFDRAAFNRALGALTRRHAILRATIAEAEDDEPRLIIAPWAPPAIATETAPTEAVERMIAKAAAEPFDLERGPLFRVRLIAVSDTDHVLIIGLHHVITDHWSMGLLMRDLSALMTAEVTGAAADLPPLPIQFADFAAWQRAALDEPALAAGVAYWRDRLAGAPSDLTLPTDRPRPAVRGSRGAARRFPLAADANLSRLATEHGATAFMAFLAVYAALLARWSGQPEVVVGCPLGSREQPETYDLVGFFVNTVALRLDLSDDPDFATLLGRAKAASLEALAHQDAPFERVVDALHPDRQLNRNPLFQAMFVVQNAASATLAWPGIEAEPLAVPAMPPEIDFNLALEPAADPEAPFTGYLEFDPELFDEETAARFIRQFAALCRAVLANPQVPVSRLPIDDGAPAVWQGSRVERPQIPLDALIVDRLQQRPDATAVIAPTGETVTAGELLDRAPALAMRLREEGTQPGQPVGICLPRGIDLVVSMLAVMRAGGAFVVLPSDAPAGHIERIARQAGLTQAIVGPSTAGLIPDGVRTIRPDARPAGDDGPREPVAGPDDLAYVCFTSGSTGTPKGVAVGQAAIVNHALAMVDAFGLTEADRVLQFATAAFDVALEEIFPTLIAGATLVIASDSAIESLDAFAAEIAAAGITVANLPAPFWHAWVHDLAEAGTTPPPGLRLVVTGSDRVRADAMARWRTIAPAVSLLSGYGPTEATVTAMLFDLARDPLPAGVTAAPLGRPIANTDIQLCDPAGQPVPIGVVGEIVIKGAGLARGYLGPVDGSGFRPRRPDGLPAYWTGDLGRRRGDGSLEFLGRRDAQVKIRGVRIEPEGVESLLAACPGLVDVAVIARSDDGEGIRLHAFVCGEANQEAVRDWMRGHLPGSMVPATVETIDAIPRTPSGKIDRAALRARPRAPIEATTTRAFNDETERVIAGLFEAVLNHRPVGPDDNFFDLGGDSISSLRIVSRARRKGLALSARIIFQHQTVAAIARHAPRLAEEGEGIPGTGTLPLTPIHAWFHRDAAADWPDWHHFNQVVVLAVPQPVDAKAIEAALAALVDCHEILRLTVSSRDGTIRQDIPETFTPPALTVLDLAGLAEDERQSRRAAAFAAAQAGLDPRAGRNLAAVLLADEGRMLLTIHHLCVDVLSWNVLLDDLEAAYAEAVRGRAPKLRRAGTPFRLWAERLRAFADQAEIARDIPFWHDLLSRPADLLMPEAGADPGTEGTTQAARKTVERALTTDILRTAPAVFGHRTDEVILAALLGTLQRRGGRRLRVDLERNGRVSPFGELDLSRTVGWFTSIVPLSLEAEAGDPATLIRTAGQAVADSPYNGLGFGLLRYLSAAPEAKALAELPPAQILLNYVGTLSGWNEAAFRPVDADGGPAIASTFRRTHPLELNAGVVEGQLRLELSFPGGAHCDDAAAALLDDIVATLDDIGRAARIARAGVAIPADVEEVLPLTPLQQGMLLHSLREGETYFNQLHLTLKGPLDAGALHDAWRRVVNRHNALRASFRIGDDGTPIQFMHRSAEPEWTESDWRGLDAAERDRRLAALMAADRARGFDFEQPPLLRLSLVRTGEARHDLIWSSHHLIMDGWSVSRIMAEVVALYREAHDGVPAALPPAPDFGTYIAWLETADIEAAKAYWRRDLTGLEPTRLVGPGLAPERAEEEGTPATLSLSAEEAGAIDALARTNGVTAGSVIQGAWALLLNRYTGQDDVVFGLTVSGRPPELPGVETMVGMLINTLPVRLRAAGETRVADWLRRIGDAALERAAFIATPLPEALAAAGLPDRSVPFDSLVLVQNYPRPGGLSAGELAITLSSVTEATDFPLTLVVDWGAEPRFMIVRDPRRLALDAAWQILGHLKTLLLAMARDPSAAIDALSLYDDEALDKRLALARGERMPVPPPPAPAIVDQWAELAPHAPAVVSGDETLNYGDLVAQSDALAARLAAAGVRPGSRVVLAVPRSATAIVAILAILKAGGAFVPLDVAYPPDRLRFMLDDCGADLIVTDRTHRERLAPGATAVLLLDEADATPTAPWSAPAIDPESPAYVIYTSGSTGRPKGVLNAHRGLRALIHALRALFGLHPGDRVLQFASLSFDASVWEIFMALGAGATLYVPGRDEALAGAELGAYMRSRRITAATLPPSLLAVIPEGAYPDLRQLVVAGEACPPPLARRWATGRRFFNGYGPSETTICATIHEGGGDGVTLPIGRAIANVDAHVLDARLRPVPPGCEGELAVGGVGVGLGYIGRPELTAERFVADPFAENSDGKLYRTGDRVRLTADAEIVFLGRIDRQIKLRGFRIEPGEVEAALAARPGVARALVGPRPDSRGEDRLLAWVVPEAGAILDPAGLRRALQDSLPGHMVPAAVMVVDSVPLTPNGKVDWAALPDDNGPVGEAAPAPAEVTILGGDGLEGHLAVIWAELLNRPTVGPDENFFDIGGHSLLLVRMQPMLKDAFGVSLKASELFAAPTIRMLARRLEAAGATLPRADPPADEPAASPPSAVATPPDPIPEPIAVIGMAGRFPGAGDIEAFWQMLVDGREGLSRFEKEDLRRAGVPDSLIDDPAYVPAGGVIDGAEGFDPAVFGLGPRDALVLDPQHRVFLECAWHALEDAGYAPGRTATSIGLFAGSGRNTWLNEVLLPAGESLAGSAGFHLLTGNDKDFLAAQAAYRLDLKGPVASIQTACSTSLVALATAVEALRSGQCAMALAGGVSITFPQGRGYLYEPDMILSPDGHCRAFAADAAGTVPGAGAGVVLLKPLARARAEGDRVLAVIRGAAVTNDGAAKMGFTAPGVDGQAAAIRAALTAAGLEADDIDYVETHGTGTALGDPVEVTALARVFAGRRDPLLLGSVKSNIGHADAAAGIAGFIKAVLALHRRRLPASLHAQPVNPRIDFAAGPFAVVDRTQPWPERDRPLRAGVSSFGIGGTNAHVIVESAPATEPRPEIPAAGDQALVLSARTATALGQMTGDLAAHLCAHPEVPLPDVAFTLQCGRAALPHRRALIARSVPEAIAALETPGQGIEGEAPVRPPAVALLLPGQGSQHPAMGRTLYETGGLFRREMDTMAEILRPMFGLSLVDLLYGDGPDDPETLRRTEIAQPAVFAVSVALARQWQGLGVIGDGMLGHSLGEYAAAHLAGVFELEDALALVVERGRLIGAMPTGAMLAVSLPEADIGALLGEALALAAVNGPRQCVVSGPEDAIAELEARLAEAGQPGRRLHTSHAFHSPLLRPAAEKLAEAAARRHPRPPRARFLSNVTGTWITAEQATDGAYWARQMLAPVRFADGLATLHADGIRLAVECGPGQTLTALSRAGGLKSMASLAHAAETPAGGSRLAATAAGLWVEGVEIEWPALHPQPARRVALPLYPFERRPFRPDARHPREVSAGLPAKRPSMASWFYRPDWIAADEATAHPIEGPLLILADAGGVGAALAGRWKADGLAVRMAKKRAAEEEDFDRLFEALPEPPRRIVHLWGLDDGDAESLEETGLHALLALARAIGRRYPGRPLHIDMATRGAAEVTGAEALRPELAAAIGALRVLPYEYPGLGVRAIDVEDGPADAMAAALLSEIGRGGDDTVVALRGDGRWVPGVRSLVLPAPDLSPTAPSVPRPGAVVLITGGFGGVGRAIACDLAREPGIRLVLAGRHAPSEDGNGETGPGDERARFVHELEDLGATVMTAAVDIADADAVATLVRRIENRFGTVNGVVHAAGLADLAGIVQTRSRADTERVLAPKIAGTRALEWALAGKPLDFLVLCSTLGSFLPAAKFGQVAYAAANEYLDLAAGAIARRTGWPVVTVNWDDWVDGGMTVEAHEAWGIAAPSAADGLTAEEGARALRRILAGRHARVAVSVRDLPALIAGAEARFAPTASAIPAKARTAPPEPAASSAPTGDGGDADATTAYLTDAFRRVLDDPDIGPDDNFFERGGHSLLAMRLLAEVRETFALTLGIADLLDCQTPRALAERLGRQGP